MKTEQEYNRELSQFQLELLDTLKLIGFEWKYFNEYGCSGHGTVDLTKFNSMYDVISHFYWDGKDQKRFEIINALGL